LAIVSGLLRPDSGDVLIDGRSLWTMTEADREAVRLRHCGFIFQGFNLFPALSARDHLEMVLTWGRRVSWSAAEREAMAMLDSLGMRDKAHLLPAQLSGGEKQRVAVGRALIKRPRLIFADEPTSALDWEHGQQVVEFLRTATRQRGASVLLVTHDPRIVPYADEVFHLDDGRMTDA
jgi:putative ABC transport system ATP-binding protein